MLTFTAGKVSMLLTGSICSDIGGNVKLPGLNTKKAYYSLLPTVKLIES